MRRATYTDLDSAYGALISIHALLAESDHYDNYNLHCVEISIHALLAESDLLVIPFLIHQMLFLSTLSLRRATSKPRRLKSRRCVFLSTLSLRRATGPAGGRTNITPDFYPRSPCGERPAGAVSCYLLSYFYPRSPCGERLAYCTKIYAFGDFYPRSPCGERPVPQQENGQAATISIHALLAESDVCNQLLFDTLELISIHALLAESDNR